LRWALALGLSGVFALAWIASAAAGAEPSTAAVAFAVLLAVIVPTALVASGRVTRSLASLRGGMDRLADGDSPPSFAASRITEFNDLGVSFNRMAARLRDSTERLEHQAFHDPLTGLPNRALFLSSFSRALAWAAQNERSVAVLFMDVDRFKYLNDSLGHGVGDQLLAVLSKRLVAAAGGHLVARLGGDEFTMLITGADAGPIASEIAERIRVALNRPFSVAAHELFVSVSIGGAVSTPSDKTITELLRKADIALYRAKADGRGRYVLFRDELDALSVEQFDLDNALRRAVSRGELLLHYQPIVDLPTGAITGTEALLRWDHPHRGILSPDTFISVAEETGEIIRIGQWVLEEACGQAVRFQSLCDGRPFTVCVNISAAEFRQPGLVDRVAQVLSQSGLTPRNLKLELTESVLIGDVPETLEILSELKGLGVGLSIDDFGTGYSSLSYLQRLPVDTLKVDQSFVAGLGGRATAGPVLRAIIELGNALFMQVVAEGIETRDQLEFLGEVGCQFGQGHYFHRAVPPLEFETLLREPAPYERHVTRRLRPTG
jgi:diguanylate cyclase (GGDEF)-like protein